MKTALLKTTLMLIAATIGFALATPVVAHAETSTQATTKKHSAKPVKKKKKKTVAKSSKVEAGSAHLSDFSSGSSMTATSSLKSSKKSQNSSKKNLTNDVVFDGSVVRGQYQIADGTTSVVENEKSLTNLIAPRRDFKDRMQAERSQQ